MKQTITQKLKDYFENDYAGFYDTDLRIIYFSDLDEFQSKFLTHETTWQEVLEKREFEIYSEALELDIDEISYLEDLDIENDKSFDDYSYSNDYEYADYEDPEDYRRKPEFTLEAIIEIEEIFNETEDGEAIILYKVI